MDRVYSANRPDWKIRTFDIVARPMIALPVVKDLPRLARYVSIIDRRSKAVKVPSFAIPDDAAASIDREVLTYCSLQELLATIVLLVDGDDEVTKAFRKSFLKNVRCGVDYGIQKPDVLRVLDGFCGEGTAAELCLKVLNQSATAPAIQEMYSVFGILCKQRGLPPIMAKDAGTSAVSVQIFVEDEQIVVLHQRKMYFPGSGKTVEEGDGRFTVDMHFVISRKGDKMGELKDVNIFYEDVSFSDSFQGPLRKDLEAEMMKNPKGKSCPELTEGDEAFIWRIAEVGKKTALEYKPLPKDGGDGGVVEEGKEKGEEGEKK